MDFRNELAIYQQELLGSHQRELLVRVEGSEIESWQRECIHNSRRGPRTESCGVKCNPYCNRVLDKRNVSYFFCVCVATLYLL